MDNSEPLNTSKYNDLRIILSKNSLRWIGNLNLEFEQCQNPSEALEGVKLDKMGSQLD